KLQMNLYVDVLAYAGRSRIVIDIIIEPVNYSFRPHSDFLSLIRLSNATIVKVRNDIFGYSLDRQLSLQYIMIGFTGFQNSCTLQSQRGVFLHLEKICTTKMIIPRLHICVDTFCLYSEIKLSIVQSFTIRN